MNYVCFCWLVFYAEIAIVQKFKKFEFISGVGSSLTIKGMNMGMEDCLRYPLFLMREYKMQRLGSVIFLPTGFGSDPKTKIGSGSLG